jgi:hypothetical protein
MSDMSDFKYPGYPELNPFQQGVVNRLRASADIFEQRAAVYKDNYRAVGRVMEALFPDGHTQLEQGDHNRWHLFELVIVKLTRYVNNYDDGGHEDSLDDMIVYLSMLGQLDAEKRAEDAPEEVDAVFSPADLSVAVKYDSDGALKPEVHILWQLDEHQRVTIMKRAHDGESFFLGQHVYLKQHLDKARAMRIDHFDPHHENGLVVAINRTEEEAVTWVHPTWINPQPRSLAEQIEEVDIL